MERMRPHSLKGWRKSGKTGPEEWDCPFWQQQAVTTAQVSG